MKLHGLQTISIVFALLFALYIHMRDVVKVSSSELVLLDYAIILLGIVSVLAFLFSLLQVIKHKNLNKLFLLNLLVVIYPAFWIALIFLIIIGLVGPSAQTLR